MRRKRGLTETWYRAPIASGLAHDAQVDFKNHVIRGAVAMEVGPAKGHDEEVDEFTINETVRLGQQLEHGAKSRFGHPELCSDALGAYAGQQKAWRVDPLDSRRALMDIHFSEFALADPSNMVERVMLRARDEPHSFGNSVVLKRDLEYRFEADGKTRLKDADGKELPPLIRPLALLGSDLVDSPAATSALFSAADHEGTSAVYSAAAAEGLDEILGRDDADDRIANFAERFFSTRPEAARRVGDIVEKYADQPTEEVKMSKPEEQVDEPATKADEGDRSLLAKLRGLLYRVGYPRDQPADRDLKRRITMTHTIPHREWLSYLAEAIETANDGDTIVCHSDAMKTWGQRTLNKMFPGKTLHFDVEVDS
jgi:hypothetical protein